ncbi:MAG: DNA polymerase IV [Candidatus Omnitrophica bacterium]|jgi:DNA polymerase-4|nr:DNA polymerase IV [Candidatus Omnitrophota bacterium]
MIIHIDMDAFFASIEQAINPRLIGKPLVVGSRGSKMHTVVCAASYAAKRLGIHSGMSSRDAFKICPNLEFVRADQSKYIWTSSQIFKLLENFNLPLNYASIDEFQLDLPDSQNPVSLGKEIKQQIYSNFKITASVGIAKTWLLAKLASKIDKPDGLTLINDDNFKEILSKTALNKLCGMGGKNGQILMDQGLKTCWDLYLKLPGFFDNCGKFRETSGNSDEAIQKPKSMSHSYTLPMAQINPQVIFAWIRVLSEMVSGRLRQDNLVSATVHLWLNGPQIGNFGAQKTYLEATSDGYQIYLRTLKIMEKSRLKSPRIRAIGVTCSSLSQPSYNPLFSEEIRREELIKALDRINGKFGESTIFPAITILTR